jgi:hypothetical protein
MYKYCIQKAYYKGRVYNNPYLYQAKAKKTEEDKGVSRKAERLKYNTDKWEKNIGTIK